MPDISEKNINARNIKLLSKYSILAKDGEIGEIHDFFFDDITWTIRYVVVDTRRWLPGRKVLISPVAVEFSDWQSKEFQVNLTREQIKNSPDIDVDKPVSLQKQIQLHDHYSWHYYWSPHGPYGALPAYPPRIPGEGTDKSTSLQKENAKGDPHLRSTKEVMGYHIQAIDGEIGHVEDFLMDEHWKIRYMVVDTRNWLPGRKVLVAPEWIKQVVWEERKVHVALTQEAVKKSPEYNPSIPVSQKYADQLHEHYSQPKSPEKIREEMYYPPPTP